MTGLRGAMVSLGREITEAGQLGGVLPRGDWVCKAVCCLSLFAPPLPVKHYRNAARIDLADGELVLGVLW